MQAKRPAPTSSSCDQLDLAARAVVIETLLGRLRLFGVAMSAILLAAAAIPTASDRETMVGRALVVVIVALTSVLWLRSRYALQVVSFLILVAGGVYLLFPAAGPPSVLHLGLLAGFVVCVASCAYVVFRTGNWFGTVQGEGWGQERLKVQEWLSLLKSESGEGAVQFSAHSFRFGDLTYRLLKIDDCWALAAFRKRGLTKGLVQYRVRPISAIELVSQTGGRTFLQLDGNALPVANVSPEMESVFLRLGGRRKTGSGGG